MFFIKLLILVRIYLYYIFFPLTSKYTLLKPFTMNVNSWSMVRIIFENNWFRVLKVADRNCIFSIQALYLSSFRRTIPKFKISKLVQEAHSHDIFTIKAPSYSLKDLNFAWDYRFVICVA